MSRVVLEEGGDAWIRYLLRQVCEKYFAKGKDMFWSFMDLEKAYSRIDRKGL